MISSCMAVHVLAWVFNAVGNNPQQYDIMQNMGRARESPENENKKWEVNHTAVGKVYL